MAPGGGELAMGAEQKIGPVPHRLPDRAAESHRLGDVGHGGLVAAAHGVGAGGIEFHRREARATQSAAVSACMSGEVQKAAIS